MWKDERKAKKNTFGIPGGVTDGLTDLTKSVKKLPSVKSGEENAEAGLQKKHSLRR